MEYDHALLRKYYDFIYKDSPRSFISEKTAQDIEIDLVFISLDFTSSKIGKQYFFSKIRSVETAEEELFYYKKLFHENHALADSVKKELSKLNEKKDYYLVDLITETIMPSQIYYNYARISLAILICVLLISLFWPKILIALIPIFAGNTVVHYLNKNYVEFYKSIIYRLQTMLKVANSIGKTPGLEAKFNGIDLKILNKNMKTVGLESALSKNEYLSVIYIFIEIFRIFFISEVFTFRKKIQVLNASKPEILKVFQYLGKVDCAISLNTIQTKMKTCTPKFIEEKHISFKNIYHPFIPNCVDNSLDLSGKSIAITGSNMSGKTSFMRNIAVNTIFAQNFGFCFANSYMAPKMQILSSISIHDDLSENKSYYLEEVLRIKDFMEDTDGFKLILIDEIFKGTNTTERIAISKTVLNHLNSSKNIVFVTTHDLEIANYLKDKNYELYFFDENIEADQLSFSYKIKQGINTKTNAVRILEVYGYPENIISEAKKLLEN